MWHAKITGGFGGVGNTEAEDNANEMRKVLSDNGWSVAACAALLGNSAGEGGLNPWRWESDNVPTYAQFLEWSTSAPMKHGYGLLGFTPAKSYINDSNASKYAKDGYAPNFSDRPGKASDGGGQMAYFADTWAANFTTNLYNYYNSTFSAIGVDINTFYYITADEFMAGKDTSGNIYTMEQMVGAFETKYEKPNNAAAASSYAHRVEQGKKWYEYFTGHPIPPTPSKSRKLPIYFYLRKF